MPRKKQEDLGPDSGDLDDDDGASGRAPGNDAPVEALRGEPLAGERDLDAALRPKTFEEYVGQRKVVDNLQVFVKAARKRGEALDHVLFCGPPGLGKTTLAHVIAHALGVTLRSVGAPAIEHKGTLASYLTQLGARDVLFIDEIHRLQPAVEE